MKHKPVFLILISFLILLSGCSEKSDENNVLTESVPHVATAEPSESTSESLPETSEKNTEITSTEAAETETEKETETETDTIQPEQLAETILDSSVINEEQLGDLPSEFTENVQAVQPAEQIEENVYISPDEPEFEDILIGTTSPENHDEPDLQEELPDEELTTVPDRVIELPFISAE